MPRTEVIFYQEDEKVPVREWLRSLPAKVGRKCLLYLEMLEQQGHDLRRPIADSLRDGIYELRPSFQGVHYRILYFFQRPERGCHLSRHHEGIRDPGDGNQSGSPPEKVLRGRSRSAQL